MLPKKKMSLQLSLEQSVNDVGITQLVWKRVPQARSCGCKRSVAITTCLENLNEPGYVGEISQTGENYQGWYD